MGKALIWKNIRGAYVCLQSRKKKSNHPWYGGSKYILRRSADHNKEQT